MKYVAPEFKKEAFNCPYQKCGAFSQMIWANLLVPEFGTPGAKSNYFVAKCTCCKQNSLWHVKNKGIVGNLPGHIHIQYETFEEMLFPSSSLAPHVAEDMPEDVKEDYEEAATIASKSPRAAAALLRLALQKLCVHLGQDGKHINTDIRALAREGTVPHGVIKAADTMRITGNESVHPGEMNEKDRDEVALKMFGLLNFIVEKAITEPQELDNLLGKIPEKKRLAAEEADTKANQKSKPNK